MNSRNLFFIPLLLFFISCNNESCDDGIMNQDETDVDCGGVCDVCPVTYDSTGVYGLNVLYGDDSLSISDQTYTFQANVPEGGSLKIKLYSIYGGWAYQMGPQNWNVGPYGSPQIFEVNNPGNAVLALDFANNGPDVKVLVQYFENSTTVTKEKILY